MDYLKYSKTTFQLLHRDLRYNHQCEYDSHATTIGCPRLLPKHRRLAATKIHQTCHVLTYTLIIMFQSKMFIE
jgi:hypothetical protein